MSIVIFPDTNVILRYLLADNENQFKQFQPIFESLKEGKQKAVFLPEVLLEAFYVLTKTYGIPPKEVAKVLKDLLLYKGVVNKDKFLLLKAFDMFLETRGLSLLDCFLCVKAKDYKGELLTFDEELKRKCS